jgi:hypothetical protein
MKVNELVLKIASNIEQLVDARAHEKVQAMLAGVMNTTTSYTAPQVKESKEPVVSAKTKATAILKGADAKRKNNYHRKPCPVPGCPNQAMPRHRMVCTNHKDLTIEQKDRFKAEAQMPGGLWYKELIARRNEKAHAHQLSA